MRLTKIRSLALFLLLSALFSPNLTFSQSSKIVSETIMVPSADSGIQLHVRNKHREGVTNFGSDRIVLFVHGAGFPSESTFDLPLEGLSWMDYLAQRGWDAYIMDIRGYGRSTRPPEMSRPAAENGPIVNQEVAVKDVGAVVDYVLSRRSVQRISLLGWSWGTTVMGAYTTQNNSKVERLVLYAPLWLVKDPTPATGSLDAYRTITKEAAEKRIRRGVPVEKQKELLSVAALDALWETSTKPDAVGAGQYSPEIRIPNGAIEDVRKYWVAGKASYDPAKITVPTFIAVAEWDVDCPPYMSQGVFTALKNAPIKRLVVIGEGTHYIAIEKNRLQLFREVQNFLEEPNLQIIK